MNILKGLVCVLGTLVVSACVTLGGPYPQDMATPIKPPPVENFSSQPVVQLTFVATVDPTAEAAFLVDYTNNRIEKYRETPEGMGSQPSQEAIPPETAKNNMKGMFAKSAYYSVQLAKYLKVASKGDYAVILNPVTLKYDPLNGYSYEAFEQQMPSFDVDINFSTYVHPNTLPSTVGEVITTYGENLAPLVSVRTDPTFSEATVGAVALPAPLQTFAANSDGKGLHANLIDYFNAAKYNKKPVNISSAAKRGGPYEKGKYYALNVSTESLANTPPTPDVISADALRAAGYEVGKDDPYLFFHAYHKLIMAALQSVDHRSTVTKSQQSYYSFFEPGDARPVLIDHSDEGKRRFLTKAREVEIQYLQDRDANWMDAMLKSNNFGASFAELRHEEQEARNKYVEAQAQAAAGAILAIMGAVAGSQSNDPMVGAMIAGAAISVGAVILVDAIGKLGEVDAAFTNSFSVSYDSQKSYVFEISEGERELVRAKDYKDFKRILKERFDARFPGSQKIS